MPESTVIRTKRDGQVAIIDGDSPVNSYPVPCDLGDFNFNVPLETIINPLCRGKFGTTPSLRLGNDQPMTLGWTSHLTDLGDTTAVAVYATLLDIINRYDGAFCKTNWVSTLGISSDVFTVTISFTVEGSDFGEADKTVSFPYTRLTSAVSEGDSDTVAVTGTSYALVPTLA
jgi:hypothetical protein